MYTIVVGFLVALTLAWIVANHNDVWDCWRASRGYVIGLMVALTTLFCFGLAIPVAIIFASQCEYDYDNPELLSSTELYAGFNDSQTNGHFYLLGGTIDEEEYIFYWEKESDGAITRHKEPFWENTRFFEKDINYGVRNVYKISSIPSDWLICGSGQIVEYIVPTRSIFSGYTFK